MAWKIPTRQEDDALLLAVTLRSEGATSREAGLATGMTREAARTSTNRVREADAKCGECIEGSYW